MIKRLHYDPYLLVALIATLLYALLILFSASNQNIHFILTQGLRCLLALGLMLALAQIPPRHYAQWTPWIFGITAAALIAVLFIGKIGQGAQRWLAIGPIRIQPSEIMKLALPMMLAYWYHRRTLPPRWQDVLIGLAYIGLPVLVILKQPDLGTAILVLLSGVFVLLLAGISWRWVLAALCAVAISLPILWHHLHGYQKARVMTFLHPERDPLGQGYHIIQSKIAIGSGGILGKGYLKGTQSHLSFLPAHTTDFIFAVCAEELGTLGCLLLIALLLSVFACSIRISLQAQMTYSRLLAGSLSATFLFSALINMGMVMGLLPVVGIPLPLISYGGTALITNLMGFGILMSIQSHRTLWET